MSLKRKKFRKGLMVLLCLTLLIQSFMILDIAQVSAETAAWASGVQYKQGDMVIYDNVIYKCISNHTSNLGWIPPSTLNILWEKAGVTVTSTPTPTAISTATPTKPVTSGYKISGYVNPDLTSSDANYKAGFKVEITGTGLSSQTDAKGYFEITGVAANTNGYILNINKNSFLNRNIGSIIVSADVQLGSESSAIELWAGDIIKDDVINMADVMEIAKGFNSVKSDSKYNESYDLNWDNAVNMSDIMILVKHFNKTVTDYPPFGDISTSTPKPTNTPTPTSSSPSPTSALSDLRITYTTTADNTSDYSGKIVIENPNTSYVWNGSFFDVFDISFETTSNITSIGYSAGGAPVKTVQGNLVKLDLGWLSMFDLGTKMEIVFQASKSGAIVYPQNFKANYVRGTDIKYPEYAELPASWSKNKTDLKASDLIADANEYYNSSATPITEKMIVNKPYHPTQVWLGQPQKLSYMLNSEYNARIQIPNNYIAMGMAFDYEFFKLNPNFMAALSSKENWTCARSETGAWAFQLTHVDGPFQQEVGNFSDMAKYMVDYFPANANHDDYTKLSSEDDPKFAAAAISSGLSLVVTRETIHAVPGVNFSEFVAQAKDPWAEYSIIDYAYNRGTANIFSCGIFGSQRQAALNMADISSTFGTGFGDHVTQIKNAMTDMNNDTSNIYDGQITWTEMDNFLTQLKKFYGRGTPTDAEWNAMKNDVHKAFDVLAQHWGGSTISFRYDFMTLLRVAKEYLPEPYNPRPTGSDWNYLIKGKNLN